MLQEGDEFMHSGQWVQTVNAGMQAGAANYYRRLETEEQQRTYRIPPRLDTGEDDE
jgi:hypothetical protein